MPAGDPAGEPARRVCLLTGAGGTLGTHFCRRFAAEYDIVAVWHRRLPDVASQHQSFLDPLAPRSELPEPAVYAVQADLTAAGQLERVVDIALARYERIDVLVNAAGYSRWHPQGLTDPDGAFADLNAHLVLNVVVPARLTGRVTTEFWSRDAAANRAANRNVINVSSLAGSRVFPGGQGAYAASKAALNQLTRHQAADLAALGVRANALAPTSFPSLVGLDTVSDAIVRLDGEEVSGGVLALDAD